MAAVTVSAIVLVVMVWAVSTGSCGTAKTLKTQSQPGGHPMTQPTAPSRIWLDPPVQTNLRDERSEVGHNACTRQIENYMRDRAVKEACEHPGVRQVAETSNIF